MSEQEPSSSSEIAESAGFVLWRVSNLWQRQMRECLKPWDITPAQFMILSGLQEMLPASSDRAVKQGELAGHCRCDVMMTSQICRSLEKAGLVARKTHESDGRAIAVIPTSRGRDIVDQALPVFAAADAAFFAPLRENADPFAEAMHLLLGERIRRRVRATVEKP